MPVAEVEFDVSKKIPKRVDLPAPEPEPEPEPTNRKPMVVQIRGSAAYKAWAEAFADKEGDTLAKLFDRAVRLLAETKGFPGPPKR